MLKGFLTALAIGLVILAVATWRDWYTRRRAERALEPEPLSSASPGGHRSVPSDSRGVREAAEPDYVTPSMVRPRRLTPDESAELSAFCEASSTVQVAAPLWDRGLATAVEPLRAVLDQPRVLVCPEGVGSMREILPVCELASRERRSLLIVTPECADDVIATLAVNHSVGVLSAAVVRADAAACRDISTATHASPVTRAELQSGTPISGRLGQVSRTVSDEVSTWLAPQDSTSTTA